MTRLTATRLRQEPAVDVTSHSACTPAFLTSGISYKIRRNSFLCGPSRPTIRSDHRGSAARRRVGDSKFKITALLHEEKKCIHISRGKKWRVFNTQTGCRCNPVPQYFCVWSFLHVQYYLDKYFSLRPPPPLPFRISDPMRDDASMIVDMLELIMATVIRSLSYRMRKGNAFLPSGERSDLY